MNTPHDPSLDGLPHWATITQVSSALLVPRTTVRGAVRRALAEGEPWVMRADADDEHSPYLIDTLHPTCLAHVKRWTQKEATPEEEEEEELDEREDDWTSRGPFPFTRSYQTQPSSFPPPVSRRSGEEVFELWPHLRDRFYHWGMQVFQNILAANADEWQWRWGELHGEGYESEEEAVVAALQSRFATQEDAHPILPAVPLSPPLTRRASLDQVRNRPFWYFPRRRRFFS